MPGPVARRGRPQLLEHSPDPLSYWGKVSPDGGHRGQEFSSPPGTERWKLEDKDAAWDLSRSAATTQPCCCWHRLSQVSGTKQLW